VFLVSDAETKLYRSFAQSGPVFTATNGVDLDFFQPRDAPSEQACTFVGALDYKPNIDGACWFAETVWPELHRRRPELRFRLVGRRPSATILALARRPGIEVIGQVSDVRPWIGGSAVVVVPLRIARGVQNKVLEALAMAKAVIASPASLNGLAAMPGEHLLAASSPQEWIETIERLLDDAELRRRLGLAGRTYVETNHTWEKCLQPFADVLNLAPAT
jgi:sugar transferase (PEP-CTERM/EpsH1 system associated)